MKKKIIIILLILIILILVTLFLINGNKNSDKVNEMNNNVNVIKTQTLENLTIEKTSITTDKNNKSTFSAEVINNSDQSNKFESIEIIIKDKNNNVMTTLYAYVGILNKGDFTKISIDSDMDISSAYSIEYKVSE